MPNFEVVSIKDELHEDTNLTQNLYEDTMQRMPNSEVVNSAEDLYDDTYHAQNLYEDALAVTDQFCGDVFAAITANASPDVYAVSGKAQKKSSFPDDLTDETEIIDNELYGATSNI